MPAVNRRHLHELAILYQSRRELHLILTLNVATEPRPFSVVP